MQRTYNRDDGHPFRTALAELPPVQRKCKEIHQLLALRDVLLDEAGAGARVLEPRQMACCPHLIVLHTMHHPAPDSTPVWSTPKEWQRPRMGDQDSQLLGSRAPGTLADPQLVLSILHYPTLAGA